MPRLIPALKDELSLNNEIHLSLALNTVANLCTRDMAEALLPPVKLHCSRVSGAMVQKKALIAALSIYRAAPHIMGDGWVEILTRNLQSNEVSIVRPTTFPCSYPYNILR